MAATAAPRQSDSDGPRRWLTLADEITMHDLHLARLTAETSPTLREGFAVGANTAAAMFIIFVHCCPKRDRLSLVTR